MRRLLFPFLILGVIGVAGGWAWSNLPDGGGKGAEADIYRKTTGTSHPRFRWPVVFVVMLVAMNFALVHLGRGGIYGLAVLSGLAPVDPFIMGLTQTAGKTHFVGPCRGRRCGRGSRANNFAKR